jgi:aryl-alcohol dehydrogenase-like predicted oxidoreductase
MTVSRICLGCMGFGDAERWVHKWVLNEENSRPIIQKALELGINFFDTANMYSIGRSEEILGRALKDFAKRDVRMVIEDVHRTRTLIEQLMGADVGPRKEWLMKVDWTEQE